MSSTSKRKETDLMKLMMADYKVDLINESTNQFYVEFHGPKQSLYEGGVWRIQVKLPDDYPYDPPSIQFDTKIYHPNVSNRGSVCLDIINGTWSPMFDLLNVFESFLPQLLLYPNPDDPNRTNAGLLMLDDPKAYEKKVKEKIEKYAKPGNASDKEPSPEELDEYECASSDEDMG